MLRYRWYILYNITAVGECQYVVIVIKIAAADIHTNTRVHNKRARAHPYSAQSSQFVRSGVFTHHSIGARCRILYGCASWCWYKI